MNFFSFLRDRLFYIFMYCLNTILILLVIELDLLQSNVSIESGNIAYIVILSLAGLFFYLAVSYVRQVPFYREAKKAKETEKLESVLTLQSAVTREQQIFQHFIHENYRQYINELVRHEERREHHDHFTNQWVHSMKTPVSVINLLLQQGRGTKTTDECKALFKSIAEENDRLENGLEMVLHTARLEKFELDVNVKRVELVSLIREVINEHKKAMIRYAIFPKVAADNHVFVETDQKWMRFILHQLTTNAIKYSKTGEGQNITYTVTTDGSTVSFRIADNGTGIPEQDLPRVFDAFFTGENGQTGAESTGMGLYLTKQVCRRLGHRVTVKSEEGKGTTVTVTFTNQTLIGDTFGRE